MNDDVSYIKLTKGKVAIVDTDRYEHLIKHKWSTMCNGKNYYAVTSFGVGDGLRKNITMQQMIMNTPKGFCCFHLDGNSLNNTISNLKIITKREVTSRTIRNKSGLIGVTPTKWGRWNAQIYKYGKHYNLGTYDTPEEANGVYLSSLENL